MSQTELELSGIGRGWIDFSDLLATIASIAPPTGLATEATLVSASNKLTAIAASLVSVDNKLTTINASVNFEARDTYVIPFAAEGGGTQYALATGFTPGTEVDLVYVSGWLTASPGATTWMVRASDVTGWTPGNYADERYTSDIPATPVGTPISDSIPQNPGIFEIPASGNVFFRFMPNAGLITGSVTVRLLRRRSA